MEMYFLGVFLMLIGLGIFYAYIIPRGELPEDCTVKSVLLIFLIAPLTSWFGIVVFGGALLVDSANERENKKAKK